MPATNSTSKTQAMPRARQAQRWTADLCGVNGYTHWCQLEHCERCERPYDWTGDFHNRMIRHSSLVWCQVCCSSFHSGCSIWHGDFPQEGYRQIQERDRNDPTVVWTLACLDCFRYRLDVDQPLTQAV